MVIDKKYLEPDCLSFWCSKCSHLRGEKRFVFILLARGKRVV